MNNSFHRLTRNPRSGMTLVEVMMAMFVFSLTALGVTGALISSQRLAQANVMRNTAHSVVQGYLEQIKSSSVQRVVDAIEAEAAGTPTETDLPTKSVSATNSGNVEEKDPLFLSGPVTGPLSEYPGVDIDVDSDGWNYKKVLLDLRDDDGDGVMREVTMDMWLDVDIQSMGYRTKAYEVIIRFEYETRDPVRIRKSGVLRNIKTDINAITSK